MNDPEARGLSVPREENQAREMSQAEPSVTFKKI